jgi:hypothetical protein
MIKSMCLAIVSVSLVGCQGSVASNSAGSGDPFAYGGGPAPQTVKISAEDGTTYTGQAGISASEMPNQSLILLMINAANNSGSHKWAAQLSLSADDFAKGDVTLALKPGSQAPNTGFIDDQNSNAPTFSNSGTMHIKFAPGRQFSATISTDSPAFSGSLGGTYSLQCFIPASTSGSAHGNDPGTPSSGAALQQDTAISSTFCQRFAWLQ